jgi:hypothetical protein
MGRLSLALAAFALVPFTCSATPQRKGHVSLSIWEHNPITGALDTRWFRGSCQGGELSIVFDAGKRVTISGGGRVIGSLTRTDGFIGCADAALREPPRGHGFWDAGWYIGGMRAVKHSVKLTCATRRRLRVDIVPSYDVYDQVDEGLIYISTLPLRLGTPETVVIASIGKSKSSLSYRPSRCRVRA